MYSLMGGIRSGAASSSNGLTVRRNADAYALTVEQTNTTTGKLIEAKDPSGGNSPLTLQYLNGNALFSLNTQNSAVIDSAALLVGKTSTHAVGYVMGYFTHVVNSAAADSSAISNIIMQANGGGSAMRAVEAQVIRPAGSLAGFTWGHEVGVHSDIAGTNLTYNVGSLILSWHTGWGSALGVPLVGTRNDCGIYLGGEDGWKHGIRYIDTDGTTVLFDVDQAGKIISGSHDPGATDTYDLGASGTRWRVLYTLYMVCSDGLEISPTVASRTNTTAGIYWDGAASDKMVLVTASTDRLRLDAVGNVVIGKAALATNATAGFPYWPTMAGVPSGTPTAYTGRASHTIDTANGRAYWYYGGAWHYATLT